MRLVALRGLGTMTRISAEEYGRRYGATTGDRVRLGDTDLWIRVGRRSHGPRRRAGVGLREEPPLADGQHDRATAESELDAVIAGASSSIPSSGCVKADIGIKAGRIAGIGRAGNPDITDGVDLTIGPRPGRLAYGLIVTPAPSTPTCT